jgi:hypothetical protein
MDKENRIKYVIFLIPVTAYIFVHEIRGIIFFPVLSFDYKEMVQWSGWRD